MRVLFFFQADCPTCVLAAPYVNRIRGAEVTAVAQDPEPATRAFVEQTHLTVPVHYDTDLVLSRRHDPEFVPTILWLDGEGKELRRVTGFDKAELNLLASDLAGKPITIADAYDGNPPSKPGCGSRHREPVTEPVVPSRIQSAARRHILTDAIDPWDFCVVNGLSDGLPVVPPTLDKVERMISAIGLPAREVIARVPPNYGEATVEKIAANAVMAGCDHSIMRVLLPLVRAACDERFNLHGIQATTHFATPLIIINGPIRNELGFACGSNVLSNVARANSTLGRAFQLILYHIGGARPGEIDMSTLGNPGKFSYVIAENEEENPWAPLHTGSAITLFGAEPPRGVSEHNARDPRILLRAVSRVLATVWSFRVCKMPEAIVILCPEHVQTLHRGGFTKADVRDFLYDCTAIPVRDYEDGEGEGVALAHSYERITVEGEPCYRKFARPEAISIVVAGGRAGKFSAVIGSWATGPRGSQMVTYPIA